MDVDVDAGIDGTDPTLDLLDNPFSRYGLCCSALLHLAQPGVDTSVIRGQRLPP